MTIDELKAYIDGQITYKVDKNSITPNIHGETLKKVVDVLSEDDENTRYSLIITDSAENTQPTDTNDPYLNLVNTTDNVVVNSIHLQGDGLNFVYNLLQGLQLNLSSVGRTDTDTDTSFDNGIKVIESVTTNSKGQVTGTNKKILPNKAYVDDAISTAIADLGSALIFKGTLDSSIATETDTIKKSLPANHKIGDTWLVTKAGTYGGKTCEVGDMFVCTYTRTTANNSDWASIQANWTAIAGSESLYWGSSTTLATIGGVQIKARMPEQPKTIDTFIDMLPPIKADRTAIVNTPFSRVDSVDFYELRSDGKRRVFIDYFIMVGSPESIQVTTQIDIYENTIECHITGIV